MNVTQNYEYLSTEQRESRSGQVGSGQVMSSDVKEGPGSEEKIMEKRHEKLETQKWNMTKKKKKEKGRERRENDESRK